MTDPAGPPDLSPREVADRLLEAVVGSSLDDLADLYAPRVVIEMPFGPPLLPARMETGREECRARFRAGSASRRYDRVENARVHQTADPEVVIVEYDLHGEMLAPERRTFVLSYVMVMTIREGLIVHSRDYVDPVAGARLLGRLPELFAALTESATP
jgi:ketosteroid isomerase-like protein